MSLALQSFTASPSPARAAARSAAVEQRNDASSAGRGTERSEDSKAPKGRHALLGALTEALHGLAPAPAGATATGETEAAAPSDRESKHALHDFVHELFAELRPTDSEGRHGRGFAWGRTSLADLAQRLDALVQRLQGGAATPAEPTAIAPTPETPAAAPAPADSTGPASTVDSALLSAFSRLVPARYQGAGNEAGALDASDALIALLRRMSQALAGSAAPDSPAAGSLLDVTV